ncbi:MAG: type 1 glutamine amidotransferase [Thermodesulfovibrionales bacterium]
MKVLIIKNVPMEGPGTIEDYLKTIKAPYQIINISAKELVPDLSHFSHLVIMGGPMAVYEMESFPFLKEEALLIERAIKSGLHVLGICLGAQMIAHVLGARVYPGRVKEIGWYEVSLTEEGKRDQVMSQISDNGKATVFQWHGDTFDIPKGAVRLASSELFENQAFRYSDSVYALQFHIEVTPDIIREWFKDEKDFDLNGTISETARLFQAYHRRAKDFYSKFFTLRYR